MTAPGHLRRRPAPGPAARRMARGWRAACRRAALGLAALAAGLIAVLAPPAPAEEVRLKDLVEVQGVRGNDLLGYGLVVGLNGTGDGLRNSPFTEEIMANILERLGVNVSGEAFKSKNAAAVLVTATLPPFARAGGRIDVTVSAIGDARSLLGGTLIMTPLNAADGQIYAVAQGPVVAGGAEASGEAAKVALGVPTSGTIPGGARIEREVPFAFTGMSVLRLALRDPDFTTAARIEQAINTAFGRPVAAMTDPGTVTVDVARARMASPAALVAGIEGLRVDPDERARVVVDHRSGTIVMGEDVRIGRVAVAQGNLSLRVAEAPVALQPNPFAPGETVVLPRSTAEVTEAPGTGLAELGGGSSLADVVAGLNALGVAPRDMIDILMAIDAAGALHAELTVR
ncbi:MAG: flagellar basal body P-ring protein FlgI [Rhodobacteraceae bacterium]|nr:flagellar basal body P-ring protein FlgI [Paracoccaceae bacterium]